MSWFRKHALDISMGVAILTLVIAIALPSLDRMRQSAGRQQCPSNLSHIGLAITLYAADHGGAYPDSLRTLMVKEDLTPSVFVCENGSARAARSVNTFIGDESDCSYLYFGDGVMAKGVREGMDEIVAFDRPDNHERDGVNILFVDGHVDFMAFPNKQPPGWWTNLQADIAAGKRPLLLRP